MMRRLPIPLAAALLAAPLLAVACAGNPAPGEEGYPYNVNGEYEAAFIAEDGFTYLGTMRLATARGGAVEGEMILEEPMGVTGNVEGVLVEDRLELSVAFEIPELVCVGVAAGSGTVAEGGAAVEGEVEITADCEAPGGATFRLTR